MEMEVTPEMVDAYIDDNLPWMSNNDRVLVFQGIAIYKYLDGQASDEWKRQHGFNTEE